ncbi:PAS domain-containing protein [Mucilaginibacter agri]|uniref:histidine kinase n=1 Tax=Mucilaginibacter agri TaxID=2695265 RepID=A0A966DTF3_9SPHI|nr:PAS domain-containing protein [Mucilaginibacter agri]NCD71198.1 PAS domain-containing protein [Mucilaginibacter agri]
MSSSESKRLEAVGRFMVLNDAVSKDLNDIVNLTAQICETPIAMVTIIDEDMQWFKATMGVDIYCNTREASFCRFTIEQDELLIIPDASVDERFKDHPFVVGGPQIRFYAGANLTTRDGQHAGTLCILDVKPKHLTESQQNALRVLAKQAINLMELSWSLQTLDEKHQEAVESKRETEASQLQLRAIFDSSKDLFVLLGKHLNILAFNKAADQYYIKTIGTGLFIDKFLSDYLEPHILKKMVRYYSAALAGHSVRGELHVRRGTPREAWLDVSFIPVKNGNDVFGVAVNASDITARKRHEEQINLQNEALQRIAILQSHEIRRPVASLMGMIELIKLEQDNPYDDYVYFKMIETTVNELDDKICNIVLESETTLNRSVN